MKLNSFKTILNSVDSLDSRQDRALREQLQLKINKKHVSHSLETPYESIICPHCQNNTVQRWGKKSDLQRYRCKNCKRTFNSLTGTPLARLRRKGHWLDYANCLISGFSIRKAASSCQISNQTSFRWRHRFLKNATEIKPDVLEGIVEVDETYFLRSEKGNRKLERPARKRGSKEKKSNSEKEKVFVLVGRDRNKNTFDALMNKFNSHNLIQLFQPRLGRDALLCSDYRSVYLKFSKETNTRHGYINISKGEYVKKDIVHIKNVYEYHSNFKFWIIHKLKGVATKYMNNYLAWYREMDEFKEEIQAHTLLLRAKSVGKYKVQPLMVTQHVPPTKIPPHPNNFTSHLH